MKVPNEPGVYLLKAIDNKLIYIGSSNSLSKRRSLHFSQIKHNDVKKGCQAMIDAYYKGDDIIFEVVEICHNYLEREQYWLDFYKNQSTYKVVNQFDADRNNSSSTDDFRTKMSKIRAEKWKDPVYRETMLEKMKATRFTGKELSKPVHVFNLSGRYCKTYGSAGEAARTLGYNQTSLASAARGNFTGRGRHRLRKYIFIYHEVVLNKSDELLEAHRDLRVISSQAWEACKKYQEGSETNG